MFTALTFNMQNGQVWDESSPDTAPVRLEDTLAFLHEQAADIIFLQEVEHGYDGGFQAEPPPNYERLRRELAGYHSVFGYPLPNPLEIPFGLGLSIFSRTPLLNFRRYDLPPADITFEYGGITRRPSHRLLLEAVTEIEGRMLRIFNTHLQAFFMIKASSNKYPTQRDAVCTMVEQSEQPTLVAGDFNSAPGETLVEQFAEKGFHASQTAEVTWKRMPFVLDHVFYNAPLKLEDCRVIPTLASDHHAVRTQFSFVS